MVDHRFKNPQASTPTGLHGWAQTLVTELRKGFAALGITYDNTASGLTADNVQAAIDEVADLDARIEAVYGPGTRGDVLVRGAANWVLRSPANADDVLTFDGTDTDFAPPGATETIIAAAPNSAFDVSEITAVTIFSVNVPNVAVGDQIKVEIDYTVLNDSAAGRTYVRTLEFDALTQSASDIGAQNDGGTTGRMPRRDVATLSVSAADLALVNWAAFGQMSGAAGPVAGTVVYTSIGHLWNSTTSDMTGTVTVAFKFHSSNAAATQTLTLHSYKITKTPAT